MLDRWRIDVHISRVSSETDYYGNPVSSSEHTLSGALFDPGSSTNSPDRVNLPESAAKLFFEEPSTDIANGDRVSFTVFGVAYAFTVEGDPLRYPKGCEVNLGD